MALVKPQGSTYAGASVRVKAGGGYKHHVVDWPLIVYFIRNTLQKVSAR